MRVLVTAGNTQALIDRVRCVTNVFTGRTGAAIAACAGARGHAVTLLTSHPEVAQPSGGGTPLAVVPYRTFADLDEAMASRTRAGGLDLVVHCAAVSDYLPAGVYAPAPGTRFEAHTGRWQSGDGRAPALADRQAGKVKSDEPELWLRMVRAPKLIDRVRAEWGFGGVLVKFKLEVGLADDRLLAVAEESRRHSRADLMVANTLEGAASHAFLGPLAGGYVRVSRDELPGRLLEAAEALHVRREGNPEAGRG
jgi:phosphopantothenoylcysteine synthetase/decarboxylase